MRTVVAGHPLPYFLYPLLYLVQHWSRNALEFLSAHVVAQIEIIEKGLDHDVGLLVGRKHFPLFLDLVQQFDLCLGHSKNRFGTVFALDQLLVVKLCQKMVDIFAAHVPHVLAV